MTQPTQQRKPFVQQNDNEVVKSLLETINQLTGQIIEMSKIVAGIQNPVYPVPMEMSKDPMFMPESEEDAHFLLKTGQIDKKEFEDMLKELKFYNSEIVVPTP